jgi:hypothetical protein
MRTVATALIGSANHLILITCVIRKEKWTKLEIPIYLNHIKARQDSWEFVMMLSQHSIV